MKIKVQHETETYVSASGYFVIRQDQYNEEQIICLSPDQCRMLAAELSKAAKNKDWWQDSIAEDEGK